MRMLRKVREELLQSDFSAIVHLLQHFPPCDLCELLHSARVYYEVRRVSEITMIRYHTRVIGAAFIFRRSYFNVGEASSQASVSSSGCSGSVRSVRKFERQ